MGDEGSPRGGGEEEVVRMEMGVWVDACGGEEGERVCDAQAAVARQPRGRRGGGGCAAGPPRPPERRKTCVRAQAHTRA